MRKLGPESPADSDRIEVKAELGEGTVKGLGGSGGQWSGGQWWAVLDLGGREAGMEAVLASQGEPAVGTGRATRQ